MKLSSNVSALTGRSSHCRCVPLQMEISPRPDEHFQQNPFDLYNNTSGLTLYLRRLQVHFSFRKWNEIHDNGYSQYDSFTVYQFCFYLQRSCAAQHPSRQQWHGP